MKIEPKVEIKKGEGQKRLVYSILLEEDAAEIETKISTSLSGGYVRLFSL